MAVSLRRERGAEGCVQTRSRRELGAFWVLIFDPDRILVQAIMHGILNISHELQYSPHVPHPAQTRMPGIEI